MLGPVYYEPVMGQNMMAAWICGRIELFSSWKTRKEKQNERGKEQGTTLKNLRPVA